MSTYVYIYNTLFLFFDRDTSKYICFAICTTNIEYNLISNLPYKTLLIHNIYLEDYRFLNNYNHGLLKI